MDIGKPNPGGRGVSGDGIGGTIACQTSFGDSIGTSTGAVHAFEHPSLRAKYLILLMPDFRYWITNPVVSAIPSLHFTIKA